MLGNYGALLQINSRDFRYYSGFHSDFAYLHENYWNYWFHLISHFFCCIRSILFNFTICLCHSVIKEYNWEHVKKFSFFAMNRTIKLNMHIKWMRSFYHEWMTKGRKANNLKKIQLPLNIFYSIIFAIYISFYWVKGIDFSPLTSECWFFSDYIRYSIEIHCLDLKVGV